MYVCAFASLDSDVIYGYLKVLSKAHRGAKSV